MTDSNAFNLTIYQIREGKAWIVGMVGQEQYWFRGADYSSWAELSDAVHLYALDVVSTPPHLDE